MGVFIFEKKNKTYKHCFREKIEFVFFLRRLNLFLFFLNKNEIFKKKEKKENVIQERKT